VLADEVEQQVERALEGVEEHRQRLGRDVEVRGHLVHRLAADARERKREVQQRLPEVQRIVCGVGAHFAPKIVSAA
jgi:hypothetical protein